MHKWLVFALVACSPDGSELAGDPRCLSICKVVEPPLAGAYAQCSDDSAQACMDQCETRIANVVDDCATCLLNGASFRTEPLDADADCDAGGTCTIDGPGGSCTYVAADAEDRDRCTRIAFPRVIVSCPASFPSARNCTATCT